MNGGPRYRKRVEWNLGRNFGRKNNRVFNSYAKTYFDDENSLATEGLVRPRSETFVREVGDQKLERRDDSRKTSGRGGYKDKSVTRDINVNTRLQQFLSSILNPRHKEKTKYQYGELVKKTTKGGGTGRSVKKYRP